MMLDRIGEFLRRAAPNAYCTGCLAMTLGIGTEDVAQTIRRLGEAEGVARQRGKCTLCGGVRDVIAARQEVA